MQGSKEELFTPNPLWGVGGSVRVPTSRYTSAEFTRLENERLWLRVWQIACRLEEVPEVGDFFEYRVSGRSFLVVRGEQDVVRVFENACLHRGTLLKTGRGSAKSLTCPFHAWCWNLDGSVNQILSPEDFPGLCDAELQLPECPTAVWGGFVFFNPDRDAEPFEAFIRPLDEHLANYRLGDQRIGRHRTMVLQANWKAVLEQFEEFYHGPGTHPQLLPGADDVNVIYDTFGRHSRMIIPTGVASQRVPGVYTEEDAVETFITGVEGLDYISPQHLAALKEMLKGGLPDGVTARAFFSNLVKMYVGDELPGLDDSQMFDSWQYTLFPNTIMTCLPGVTLITHAQPNGADPETCIFHLIVLQLPMNGQEPPPPTYDTIDNPLDYHDSGLAFHQDMQNTPKIQIGMHSRPYVEFAAYQEKSCANRHRAIDEYLAD